MVKPFYDAEKREYEFGPWGSWAVRPRPERDGAFTECVRERKGRLGRSKGGVMTERDEEMEEWDYRFVRGREYGDEELGRMREADPEAWWMDVVRIGPGRGERHWKRCPSCGGQVVRVGSTFKIPARRDEKGWREVERMIEEGVDMVARFSYCMTFEEHDRAMEKLEGVKAEGVIL